MLAIFANTFMFIFFPSCYVVVISSYRIGMLSNLLLCCSCMLFEFFLDCIKLIQRNVSIHLLLILLNHVYHIKHSVVILRINWYSPTITVMIQYPYKKQIITNQIELHMVEITIRFIFQLQFIL